MSKRRKKYYRSDEFLKRIGENIRWYRLQKGMTQTELAFECDDVDYSQINRMELGKVNFSVCYLELIATALKITPTQLLESSNR